MTSRNPNGEVELQTAYHWNCPNCSEDNYGLPSRAELTDEDAEQIFRDLADLEEWEELPDDWRCFEMISLPETVICSQCMTEYDTTFDDSTDWEI